MEILCGDSAALFCREVLPLAAVHSNALLLPLLVVVSSDRFRAEHDTADHHQQRRP